MNKFYIFLILLVLAILGGTAAFFYMWHKPRQGIASVVPEAAVSTAALAAEFMADTAAAGNKYADKVISLFGRVDDTETDKAGSINAFFTEDSVEIQCAFDTAFSNGGSIKQQDSLKIKCLYIGYTYDELFGLQVKFKDCIQE